MSILESVNRLQAVIPSLEQGLCACLWGSFDE